MPIDHKRVIDGFGELQDRTYYEDETLECGDCGRPFVFTAAAQKYVFEIRGVPVKMRHRRGAFCDACRDVRGARNRERRRLAALLNIAQAARTASDREPENAALLLAWVAARVASLEAQPRRPSQRAIDALRAGLNRVRRIDPLARDLESWARRVEELASG